MCDVLGRGVEAQVRAGGRRARSAPPSSPCARGACRGSGARRRRRPCAAALRPEDVEAIRVRRSATRRDSPRRGSPQTIAPSGIATPSISVSRVAVRMMPVSGGLPAQALLDRLRASARGRARSGVELLGVREQPEQQVARRAVGGLGAGRRAAGAGRRRSPRRRGACPSSSASASTLIRSSRGALAALGEHAREVARAAPARRCIPRIGSIAMLISSTAQPVEVRRGPRSARPIMPAITVTGNGKVSSRTRSAWPRAAKRSMQAVHDRAHQLALPAVERALA